LRLLPYRWAGYPTLFGGVEELLSFSVRSRPGARRGPAGGLPRAPDGTGRLTVVRPGRFKGRTAVFRQDGGPYRVRHVSAGQGDGRQGTAGDR